MKRRYKWVNVGEHFSVYKRHPSREWRLIATTTNSDPTSGRQWCEAVIERAVLKSSVLEFYYDDRGHQLLDYDAW